MDPVWDLPRAPYRVGGLRRVLVGSKCWSTTTGLPEALGKDELTLGKLFAESSSRQRAVGKTSTGKGFFAESPSRQNIYRE